MTRARGRLWKPIVAAALSAIVLGALGALVTDLSPWYYALHKPAWQPPDWLFGPVWTTIFGLAAIAGVLAWRQAPTSAERARIVGLFALNAVLNVTWSYLFFRLHRPDFALDEVALLWLSVAVLMVVLWRFSHLASLLLLPYLLWVSFASVLNQVIVSLNQPFS